MDDLIKIQQLLDEGNVDVAKALLLKSEFERNADSDRRKLAKLYSDVDLYDHALEQFEALDSPDQNDLIEHGICHFRLSNREAAIKILRTSLLLKETSRAYYILSIALADQKQSYQLEKDVKQEIIDLLNKATRLDYCGPVTFLELHKYLDGYTDDVIQKRGANLKLALSRHPDHSQIRTTYAEFLRYPAQDPKECLEVLSSLLENDDPEALWIAYGAAKDLGDYAQALSYIGRLKPTNGHLSSISKVKGDLLLKLGEFDEAIEQFNREIASKENGERQIIGLFSRSFANLQKGDVSQASKDAENAALLCFELDECDFHATRLEFCEGHTDMYGVDECVYEVCKAFIQGKDISPIKKDSETFGRLCYLFSKYETSEHKKAENDEEEEDEENFWLNKASEILSHPILSGELSDRLWARGECTSSLEHHLDHSIWKFQLAHKTGGKRFLSGRFYNVVENKISKKDLKEIHKILSSYLEQHSDDPALSQLFLNLYQSTWSSLLWSEKMFKEMLAVTSALSPLLRTSEVWFDFAYAANTLEKNGQAEDGYRECLRLKPENASALHNLSLLVEKSDLSEAISLSQRAFELSPKDELIKQRYERFKPVIHFKKSADLSLKSPVDFDDLSLKDRLYLGAVLVACLSEDQEQIYSLSESNQRLAPGKEYETKILCHLWHSGILVLDPHSNVKALSLDGDGDYRAKLHQVRWILNVKSMGNMSRAKLLTELVQPGLIDSENQGEATELWREVACEEGLEYLQHKRDSVQLSAEISDKTREYFNDLIQRYSTAQLYNIVWNSVRNAVMFQREKGLSNAHAANLVASQCKQYGDKVEAEGWALKAYRREFDLPQTIVSQLLYNRLLGIGEMGFNNVPGSYPAAIEEREATPLLES